MSRIRLFRHWVAVATFGALASAGCFVVDDTDDDDDDGNAGEAGESNGGSSRGGSSRGGRGGTEPTGGTENGGSSAGGSENGGSSTGGGPPAGGSSTGGSGPGEGAVMKYCNELYRTNPDTMMQEAAPLTLLFAGVRATALSGTCTPVVPNACIGIPAGSAPTVALLDGEAEIVSGNFPGLVIADGDEFWVIASSDPEAAEPMPTVFAGTFAEIYGPGYSCAETDPFTTPPPEMLETKSAPFSVPLERNLRSELRPAANGWSKKRAAF